jgi:hypothetical protein
MVTLLGVDNGNGYLRLTEQIGQQDRIGAGCFQNHVGNSLINFRIAAGALLTLRTFQLVAVCGKATTSVSFATSIPTYVFMAQRGKKREKCQRVQFW